jgi:hypothetical protein
MKIVELVRGGGERDCGCSREQDALDALASGRWPERADAGLRSHVAGCQMCSDLVDSVGPLLSDRADLSHGGHLPSSGVMWWRAQMRARQEATREAARPITIAQTVGFACIAVLAAVAIAWVSPVIRTWAVESTVNLAAIVGGVEIRGGVLSQSWLLLLMACVWLVLAPLAIYFAVAED